MEPTSQPVPRTSLGAILLAAMMVLVLQIAVTRVLSASVSHHAAFAVIATVMLGLATSASIVFVHRNRRRDPVRLPAATNAFLASAVLCVVGSFGFVGLTAIHATGLAALPVIALEAVLFFSIFFATGYGIAFILAEYPVHTGRVYLFDLVGAAAGCLLVIPMLDWVSPLVVVLWCGVIAALAAVLLSRDSKDGRTRLAGGVAATSVIVALVATAFPGLTALRVAKGVDQSDVLFETWNRLSRVTVQADIPGYERAVTIAAERYGEDNARRMVSRWRAGWAMSRLFEGDPPEIRWLLIDADAGTQIVHRGPERVGTASLDYLGADVTAIAYHLRKDAMGRAFVIGGGGGRDVLTALHFGAEQVDVAELNPDIVRAVDDVFGDFSGRVYSQPQVNVLIGDARSTLTRLSTQYDMLQMSMIDTWASSVAGAMVLSENALYTREAFELYFDRLSPEGILTVSRWFLAAGDGTASLIVEDGAGEASRTVALLGATLRAKGVSDPERHIAMVANGGKVFAGVASLMMKKTPFTEAEIATLRERCAELDFRLLWPTPDGVAAPSFDVPAILREDPATAAAMHLDLTAPTDDRPFFFNHRPLFLSWYWQYVQGVPGVASRSLVITGSLLLVFLVVGRILSVAPLERYNESLPEEERTQLREHLAPLAYFAGIGIGFMLIEVAVLQRYLTFLGHPTYAMSVVLFSLLLAGGFGSFLSDRIRDASTVWLPISVTAAGAAVTAFAVPPMLDAALGWSQPARVALAIFLVVPLGLSMGMMYPLGVRKLVEDRVEHLIPWVWSINGIAGSVASIIAMMVAISQGYTVVILLGVAAYGVTLLASRRDWRVVGG